jgi:two-component system, NarL family, nitrate/nitrite response regulator NarL
VKLRRPTRGSCGQASAAIESGCVTTLVVIAAIRFYREGLAALFADRDGFELAGTAVAREDGLVQVQRSKPDVVLVAIGPGAGAPLVRELVATGPDLRIVILGITDDDPEVLPLAEAGVAGYVTTDASGDDIVLVVESVARGEMPCSPRLAATLLQRVGSLAQERRAPSQLASLTVRERQIVDLLGDGLSNKEIARDLQIEVTTVKNHVHHILEKLQVKRRADAAAFARGRTEIRSL